MTPPAARTQVSTIPCSSRRDARDFESSPARHGPGTGIPRTKAALSPPSPETIQSTPPTAPTPAPSRPSATPPSPRKNAARPPAALSICLLPQQWLPFVDDYRTLCIAPPPTVRAVFERVGELALAM